MNFGGWFGRARARLERIIERIPLSGAGKGNEQDSEADLQIPGQEPEPEPEPEPGNIPHEAASGPQTVRERSREYVAISRVGSVRRCGPRNAPDLPSIPSSIPTVQEISGPSYYAVGRLGGARVKAPAPSSVRNMHKFSLTPLSHQPAEFVVSEYSGGGSGAELDLGDDLFSFVARTINLKMRRNSAGRVAGTRAKKPEAAADVEPEGID